MPGAMPGSMPETIKMAGYIEASKTPMQTVQYGVYHHHELMNPSREKYNEL